MSRRDEYNAYLQSKEWQEKRQFALTRAEYKCQVCNKSLRLEVHHRSYDRLFQPGEINDLIVLCEWCHRLHHAGVLETLMCSMQELDDVAIKMMAIDEGNSVWGRSARAGRDMANAMHGLLFDHYLFFGGNIGSHEKED